MTAQIIMLVACVAIAAGFLIWDHYQDGRR